MSRERDGSSVYFAPDLETLLSPVFLEDHCFRLTTGKDANLVGIAFEPTPNRKRLPEIRGTMWLDRATSGLQRLEFRYVNVTIDEEEEARGEIDFVPARNGAWAILVSSLCGTRSMADPGIIVGRIVLVRDTMPFHTLRVRAEWTGWTVREQGSGVSVQRPVRSVDTRADAAGTFRICGVPLNTDIVLRAESDSGGRAPGMRRSANPVQLRITPDVRVARTELRVDPARTVGAVFAGVVLGDTSGLPLAGAEVVLPNLARTAVTDVNGAFRLVGIPERAQTDALSSFSSISFVRGSGSSAWPLSTRPPAASIGSTEWMYEPDTAERYHGMRTACYAQVYVNRQLMNPGKPTPRFNVNSILPSSVEAIEVYASRMQTPPQYNTANAMCGVVVIWTRRSR